MAVRIDRTRVRLLMAERGIDEMTELARLAEIHPDTIYKVLRGNTFRSDTLEALARALQVNPVDLLTIEGHPAPQPSAPALMAA